MSEEDSVAIRLSADEALVLYDLLHRWEDQGVVGGPLEPGEQESLWAVSALLERQLVEPFAEDYDVRVQAARRRLLPDAG
jgi:hypothetical protein